jgi:two-component system, cell cycle sensor histidine kinase and response regulator CckA
LSQRTGEDARVTLPTSSRPTTIDYEDLLDSLDCVIWEADPDTFQFRFVSEAAERLLGFPTQAWLEAPKFFTERLHPEDRDRVLAECQRLTAAGEDHQLEYRLVAKDGRIVWVRDIVRVISERGRPVSCRGVMLDITELKQVEEALALAQAHLLSLVTNAPVVLFELDRSGVVTRCEGKGLTAAHLKPSDFIGRSASQLFPDSPKIRENLLRALRGDSFSDTVTYRGRVFETRYSSVRNQEGAVEGVLGISTDVTERVRAEEEQVRLEGQLRQAQKLESLGVLAGGIAHDFNNLLMTILGSVHLAAKALAPDSSAQASLKRIRDTARRAADLTGLLLAYAGHVPPTLEPVDLSELIRGMMELLTVSVSKKATLQWELAERMTAVEGDRSQLSQVVLNLVTNASEALGKGSGTIVVRTGQMDCTRRDLLRSCLGENLAEGRYVFLEVNDTGTGMDEATQSRIFDPFFSTKFTGRGLGLATVLGILGGHNGAIGVHSNPGLGSTFRVLLPQSKTKPAARRLQPARETWKSSGTVLLVDDDPDVREVAELMLRDLGFEVMTAADGREALEKFSACSHRIAAVVLDMTMPELGGDEVLAALRHTQPDTPIVLMSGFSKSYATARIRSDARCTFLQKPFEPEELAAALRSAIEQGNSAAD